MRIIGGTARGKKLIAPEGLDTRPTADRIRESLFNLLMRDIPGARVLDLFCGTGALGAEALSRGAAYVLCVDISPKACEVARQNIALKGVSGTGEVLLGDWERAVSLCKGRFDVVFLDPPYRMTDVYGQAFTSLLCKGKLSPGAIFVMEILAGANIPLPPEAELFDRRKYGATELMLVRAAEEHTET